MPYGTTLVLERHVWERAIPRVNEFRQVLLIASGHRPATKRSPLDWVCFWMNGTTERDFLTVLREPYVVEGDPSNGSLLVTLDKLHCPGVEAGGYCASTRTCRSDPLARASPKS